MIGEVADTKLSPKLDKSSGGKSALAALDSKRLAEQVPSKAAAQAEQQSGAPPGEDNAAAGAAEQVSPRHGAAAKDPKPRNGSADSACAKRTSASPKKRPATSSTSSSSLSPASPAVDKSPPRAQAKSAASATSSKDKSDGPAKTGKGSSSRTATPLKKGSSQTTEVLRPDSAQQRSGSPGSQSSHPQKKTSPRGEKSSVSARTKGADRSASRESSRNNVVSEKKVNHGGPPRPSAASRAEGRPGRAAENRAAGRSSSSSSSVTSLRSSSVGVPSASGAPPSRGPQRNSKTEDKGLSFFKTALRTKETRKAADGGKAGPGEARAGPEDGAGDGSREGVQQAAGKSVAPGAQANGTAAKDKESSKVSAAAKHSLPPSARSKLPGADAAPQASATGKDPSKKEPAKKTMASRKIPISSTQTSQRAK